THLPALIEKRAEKGYEIEAQARFSPRMLQLTDRVIFPTYHEKTQAGLRILDGDERVIFETRYPERVYKTFDSIPDLIVKTLLFIENRELLDPRYPYRNPAVEWDRLAMAALQMARHVVDRNHNVPGGSTLATQMEKFRHSPEGRTSSPIDKLKQMASASLRAYLDGEETLNARYQIILDYINSVPLAALPDYGEVRGLGDGLWAWYESDFDAVNRLLADNSDQNLAARALAYRKALSLLLAQRRPVLYLIQNREALNTLTNSYLSLLAEGGVISLEMRDAALKAKPRFRRGAPALPEVSFLERKADNAIRTHLLSLLNVPRLYDLDRFDLTVKSTLDVRTQKEVTQVLRQVGAPAYANSAGLRGEHLLERGNPGGVIYSFTLYERVQNANLLRVQTDNFDQPLNINEGVKLELGSTAKLRTLVNYLDIIANLHGRYARLPRAQLRNVSVHKSDRLSQWVISYLSTAQDTTLTATLEAAMERRYSANPGEGFFTGGGVHTFANFNRSDNGRSMSVREAFHNSVNLVFIRLMRDIVYYYMFQGPDSTAKILEDSDDPRRQEYLSRFADREGQVYMNRFYNKYQKKTPEEAMETLLQGVRPIPARFATAFRVVRPEADIKTFAVFMRSHLPDSSLPDDELQELYEKYAPNAFILADQGYIARVHPLELWLVAYLRRHPGASRSEVIKASANERQEVYKWLFSEHRKHAQDTRIKTLLEAEAFQEIENAWKRVGYPFDSLIPSYATAIGSSADRPAALAELVGIILNNGVRYPTIRAQELHFAKDTPYETIFRNDVNVGEQVLPPEVAATVKRALLGVVEKGTAKRVSRAFVRSNGSAIPVGGKTGTGDNRRESYGARGRLISSQVINRTATFVFLIGDRFYGALTAYVAGPEAARYSFTSSLPVQLLKTLAPKLMPLIEGTYGDAPIDLISVDTASPPKPKPKRKAKPKPVVIPSPTEPSPRDAEPQEGTPSEVVHPLPDAESPSAVPPTETEQSPGNPD
ncbi:penicillin-binding protein, partial [Candidatus Poribacteria bacterium]|nr:penicillin-binding protein [Candidatus Poribacteria bacterium]